MYMAKKQEDKKEFARILYMQGDNQDTIADKVGVTRQTISRWVTAEGWQAQRAAKNITRPELVNKLLVTIDQLIDNVNSSEDPAAIAGLSDKLAKFSATIERLDKHSSVVDVIEVFMAFGKWLQYQAQFDEGITPELIKKINYYQNKYIEFLMQERLDSIA